MYTLDTNAIIYYANGIASVVEEIERLFCENNSIYVSTITELELFSYPNLNQDDIEKINGFLTTIILVPVDSQLARVAGYLRRQYRLKTADSVVAATALLTRTALVTRNIRDFRHIEDLLLLPI